MKKLQPLVWLSLLVASQLSTLKISYLRLIKTLSLPKLLPVGFCIRPNPPRERFTADSMPVLALMNRVT